MFRLTCSSLIVSASLAAVVSLPSDAIAQQRVNRELYIENRCAAPIRLFVHHRHADGNMVSHGWFTYPANQRLTAMINGGRPLVHLDGEPLYFYAETTSGATTTWEGNRSVTFNGVQSQTLQANLFVENGRLALAPSCPDRVAGTPPAAQPAVVQTPRMTLSSGFSNDPRTTIVRLNGVSAASRFADSCAGYVSNQPSLHVDYRAGDVFPLIISASSTVDTVLAVRAPDGRWYCDDDGGEGPLNPSVRWNRPASGVYQVWVGSYSRGANANANATIYVSELESQ